jgi:peroxiredoxin
MDRRNISICTSSNAMYSIGSMVRMTKLLLLALLWHVTPALAVDAQEGKPAPAFEATTLQGAKFSLAAQNGKVVIIHYWATWCDSCREEMPVIESYYKEHQNEGLVVLAVSIDEASDVAEVNKVMNSYSFPAAMVTNSKARGYGRIWRVPLTFVVDRQGVLRQNGWFSKTILDRPSLEKMVTPLLKSMH